MDTAAEVLLLLTAHEGGPESWGTQTGWALGAATIADLLLEGRVHLDDGSDPRVRVVDPSPTGRPVLDKVLARCVEREGARLSSLVQDGRLDPEQEVVESLVDAGVIEVTPARLLGLVPAKRPTLDETAERRLRERLHAVLLGAAPGAAEATVLAILQALGVTRKVLASESEAMSARELERRVEQASAQAPVGAAVTRAMEALNTAIMAAVIVPTVTAT